MSARSASLEKIAPERYTDVNGETSMAAEPIRKLFTTDEYHTMAESGILSEDDRVELIEGEIWQMTPIGAAHVSRSGPPGLPLQGRLGSWGRDRLRHRTPFLLDERSEPEPDVLVLRFREDFYAGAPPHSVGCLPSRRSIGYDRRL